MFIKVAKNDFTRKRIILSPLQKLPKNVRDLGKLIVAKGFKKLPKVQKIAQSGHTGCTALDKLTKPLYKVSLAPIPMIH